MTAQLPLPPLLSLLVSSLAVLTQPTSAAPLRTRADETVSADGGHSPLSVSNTDGAGASSNDGTASSSDTSVIGDQPATVQLGAGFIVGCVIGVMLYTATRLLTRLLRRRMAARSERQTRQQAGDGILVAA